MDPSDFSILISTRNRRQDLLFSLRKLRLLLGEAVLVVVYDDGSHDGTYAAVAEEFPMVRLLRNDRPQGLLYCRNRMLNETQTHFAISLDDDAHLVTEDSLRQITSHFASHPECGLLALRIFWGLDLPLNCDTSETPRRVKGFVGCGHVWRMESWRKIPNYPEWFKFYGEEDFASYHLFHRSIEIHYLPYVLVQHRVDVAARKKQPDYVYRLRLSLRSGWFLYLLFYPLHNIPRLWLSSVWSQLSRKVFRGDFGALRALILAILDLSLNMGRIIRYRTRFTNEEYLRLMQLPDTPIYWTPENE